MHWGALQRAELTSLLNYHRNKEDPPLSKTIGGLREQWDARKWRMDGLFSIDALIKNNENIVVLNTRTPPDSGNVTSRNGTNSQTEQSFSFINGTSTNTSTFPTNNNGTCTGFSDPDVENYFDFGDTHVQDLENMESAQL